MKLMIVPEEKDVRTRKGNDDMMFDTTNTASP